MAPKKLAAKKSSTAISTVQRRQDAQHKRALKEKADQEALAQWIDAHDPLLDKAAENPIQMEELFSAKLVHRTFALPGAGESPYDWSEFRKVLESRTASSPRWFMQLREEDLLAGDDGMEGVTVDCYVIAEATQPTVAPGEYIVKVHWPYSDVEDNAPERILPLEGQGMCWRRVVKADGGDMNVFLLQKRSMATNKSGIDASFAATPGLPAFAFGFPGSNTAASPRDDPTAIKIPDFGFGKTFSAAASISSVAATATSSLTPGFGFGAVPRPVGETPAGSSSGTSNGFSFGFGSGPSTVKGSSPSGFDFGFSAAKPAPASAAAAPAVPGFSTAVPGAEESGEVEVHPLKTSEVLFALWSRKRLADLSKEIRSGSRIVREDFPLDATTTIKLVMQNDRKDDAKATVHRLLLNRLFAKKDRNVKAIDAWINDCPVFDEALASALQAFRERQLNDLASKSDLFQSLHDRYHAKIEAELQRIVTVRGAAANKELERINAIMTQMKQRTLAEKSSFRLLKFYAKNDILKFRPFGKISGICEMGESVDVCVPPAHVNLNPFTGKPI